MLRKDVTDLAQRGFSARFNSGRSNLAKVLISINEQAAFQNIQGGPMFGKMVEIGAERVRGYCDIAAEELTKAVESTGYKSQTLADDMTSAIEVLTMPVVDGTLNDVLQFGTAHAPNRQSAEQNCRNSLFQALQQGRLAAAQSVEHFALSRQTTARKARLVNWERLLFGVLGALAAGLVGIIVALIRHFLRI